MLDKEGNTKRGRSECEVSKALARVFRGVTACECVTVCVLHWRLSVCVCVKKLETFS